MGLNKNGSSSSMKESVRLVESKNEILELTKDRYQVVNIVEDTEIILPNVKNFTRIHLFFTVENDSALIFPQIKYQTEPQVSLDKTYEFIFTYVDKWVMRFYEYGQDVEIYEEYQDYPLILSNEKISEEYSCQLIELDGNTVDGQKLGFFEDGHYIVEFKISTSSVKFGKGGKIE